MAVSVIVDRMCLVAVETDLIASSLAGLQLPCLYLARENTSQSNTTAQ